MSKIAFTPDNSGTGTFTIASPNSNTDRTLTLPDATGTVNVSGLANEVPAGSAGAPAIYSTGDSNTGVFFPAADTVAVATGGSERVRVDSSGNVGIGTSSPAYKLDIDGGADNTILRLLSTDDTCAIILTDNDSSSTITHQNGDLIFNADSGNADPASSEMVFQVDGTERMRIDSSGNLLVGKTTTTSTDVGARISQDGVIVATRDSNIAMYAVRVSSEGPITEFRVDGTTVGHIGAGSGELFVDGATGDCGIQFGGFVWKPRDNGATADNAVDIGNSNFRFDDIYATNPTINTSDRNEKQDIRDITEAEARVAQACKGLLKAYRWKDAVAEKGEEARIHFGIIAQDLQAAFAAEGLDAGRYAMFISSTWWELDGKIYETAEEAPEGATERTRLGIRYPELLAFIISAL